MDKVQEKIEQAEKVAETAIELNEALQEQRTERQAAGILRTCLNWLPAQVQWLVPVKPAQEALDRGIEAKDYDRNMTNERMAENQRLEMR